MMQVTVQYMAQMKRAAGCSSESAEVPVGSTLRDVLQALAGRRDQAFRAMLIDERQEPRKSLLFFVGDEHAEPSRPLREGDEITILAPMAGG